MSLIFDEKVDKFHYPLDRVVEFVLIRFCSFFLFLFFWKYLPSYLWGKKLPKNFKHSYWRCLIFNYHRKFWLLWRNLMNFLKCFFIGVIKIEKKSLDSKYTWLFILTLYGFLWLTSSFPCGWVVVQVHSKVKNECNLIMRSIKRFRVVKVNL